MAVPTASIFDRFGLRYRAVAADSGAIGGDLSEEFQVIAATGEDAIVYCPDSRLRRQYGKSRGACACWRPQGAATQPMAKVATPGKSTCEDVAALLGVPLQTTGQVTGAGHRCQRRQGNVSKPRSGCCCCAVTTT
jgi:prolyl-tRNA synthetase